MSEKAGKDGEMSFAKCPTGSLQGDTDFLRVLALMGVHVEIGRDAITVAGTGRPLRGIEVNMRDISDTMPTLAAIAPFADGPVRTTDVYNTRVKESDRLDACAENLRRLGVPVTEGRDWIEISPAPPRPTVIDCRDDHRIAMSFSVTGLQAPGLTLDNPQCVRKTFPLAPDSEQGVEMVRSGADGFVDPPRGGTHKP